MEWRVVYVVLQYNTSRSNHHYTSHVSFHTLFFLVLVCDDGFFRDGDDVDFLCVLVLRLRLVGGLRIIWGQVVLSFCNVMIDFSVTFLVNPFSLQYLVKYLLASPTDLAKSSVLEWKYV